MSISPCKWIHDSYQGNHQSRCTSQVQEQSSISRNPCSWAYCRPRPSSSQMYRYLWLWCSLVETWKDWYLHYYSTSTFGSRKCWYCYCFGSKCHFSSSRWSCSHWSVSIIQPHPIDSSVYALTYIAVFLVLSVINVWMVDTIFVLIS